MRVMGRTISKGLTKGTSTKVTKGRTAKNTKNTVHVKGTRSIGSVMGVKRGVKHTKGMTPRVTTATTAATGTKSIGSVAGGPKGKVSGDKMSTVVKSTKGKAIKSTSRQSAGKPRSGYKPIQLGNWLPGRKGGD